MGVFFAIAQKNEDKENARQMIKNYVIGLVVIFAILVACPYLVKGIAALIAGEKAKKIVLSRNFTKKFVKTA